MSKNLEDSHLLTRREFTAEWVLAMLAGATNTITSCGKDKPAAPTPVAQDVNGTISANHGHTATVTAAQITAANAVTITLVGGTHTHTAQLTASQVQQIGAKQQVAVTSSTDAAHQHTVTFN